MGGAGRDGTAAGGRLLQLPYSTLFEYLQALPTSRCASPPRGFPPHTCRAVHDLTSLSLVRIVASAFSQSVS